MLPIIGLLLFASVTYESLQKSRHYRRMDNHYFWWSTIALDSDPLHRNEKPAPPCDNAAADCVGWDPRSIWATPGIIPALLVLSALPAFFVGMLFVRDLGYHGISEVVSFMASMPIFIGAWYFLVGWLIDHWWYKRSISRHFGNN